MAQLKIVSLEELAESLFAFDCDQRIIAMLSVYFDESGTHAGCPAMTVAGWLSPAYQWKKFQKEWKKCLDDAGVAFFHMTDYESRHGIYKNWTKQTRIRVLTALHKIARKRTIIPVSASVPIADYEQIRSNYAEPNSPYIFCVLQCLRQIETWADEIRCRENIAYFFESGSGYGNDLHALFQSIKQDPVKRERFRLSTWTFGDKKELSPLQAADMLAFEGNKEMLNCKVSGMEVKPIRKSAISLISGKDKHCVFFGKDNLERALNLLNNDPNRPS